jgi:uncharacterized protein (DUF1778 family)
MAVKTERIEARLSADQRSRIERAASTTGLSVSTFMVDTAVERADEILAVAVATTVPAEYFDELLAALDDAGNAPRLTKTAQQVHRSPRITAR